MRGLNKVSLIGNLGRDPESTKVSGDIAVSKFPLATTEIYKTKDGQASAQTEWHTVVVWRNLAELAARYLQKGSLVYIEGKLRTRRFEDKDGKTRYTTEIFAEQLIMLDKKDV